MEAVTPLPPTGAEAPDGRSIGGHAAVHSVLRHVTLPPLSAESMYRVLPAPFTRIVPMPLTLADFTAAVDVDPPELGFDPVVVEPLWPQAATTRASSIPGTTKRRGRPLIPSISYLSSLSGSLGLPFQMVYGRATHADCRWGSPTRVASPPAERASACWP